MSNTTYSSESVSVSVYLLSHMLHQLHQIRRAHAEPTNLYCQQFPSPNQVCIQEICAKKKKDPHNMKAAVSLL